MLFLFRYFYNKKWYGCTIELESWDQAEAFASLGPQVVLDGEYITEIDEFSGWLARYLI